MVIEERVNPSMMQIGTTWLTSIFFSFAFLLLLLWCCLRNKSNTWGLNLNNGGKWEGHLSFNNLPQPFSSRFVNVQENLIGVCQSSTAWDCWRRNLSLRKRFSVLVSWVGALSGYDYLAHYFFRPLVGISWICPTYCVFFLIMHNLVSYSNLKHYTVFNQIFTWLMYFLGSVLEHFDLAAIYRMYMVKYLLS